MKETTLFLCLLICFGCSGKSNNQDLPSKHSISSRIEIRGYYLATDVKDSSRAWVFFLDSKKKRGSFYDPPNQIEKLQNVIVDSLGKVEFTSILDNGFQYSFSGSTDNGDIIGTFKEPIYKHEYIIKLHKISIIPSEISGIYSNIYYNEEGGDLLGEEFFLIPDSSGQEILITIAEGQATTLRAFNVAKSEDGIHFNILYIDQKFCKIQMLRNKALFYFSTNNSFNDSAFTLKRIHALTDLEKIASD